MHRKSCQLRCAVQFVMIDSNRPGNMPCWVETTEYLTACQIASITICMNYKKWFLNFGKKNQNTVVFGYSELKTIFQGNFANRKPKHCCCWMELKTTFQGKKNTRRSRISGAFLNSLGGLRRYWSPGKPKFTFPSITQRLGTMETVTFSQQLLSNFSGLQ